RPAATPRGRRHGRTRPAGMPVRQRRGPSPVAGEARSPSFGCRGRKRWCAGRAGDRPRGVLLRHGEFEVDGVKHWRALIVLGTAQFLMVLDTSVMNVSISQLVDDFDTEVTAIQAVITLYALVMASFMLIGGRFGDILGRRRVFLLGLVVYGVGSALAAVAPPLRGLALGRALVEGLGRRRVFLLGLVVYGVGSALTAVAPSLWVLTLGWSVIEGLGAAMVLPAMAALVAEAYRGRDRAVAYAVIGGLAGAGIAVGPLL